MRHAARAAVLEECECERRIRDRAQPSAAAPARATTDHDVTGFLVEVHVSRIRKMPLAKDLLDRLRELTQDRLGDVLIDLRRRFFLHRDLWWGRGRRLVKTSPQGFDALIDGIRLPTGRASLHELGVPLAGGREVRRQRGVDLRLVLVPHSRHGFSLAYDRDMLGPERGNGTLQFRLQELDLLDLGCGGSRHRSDVPVTHRVVLLVLG